MARRYHLSWGCPSRELPQQKVDHRVDLVRRDTCAGLVQTQKDNPMDSRKQGTREDGPVLQWEGGEQRGNRRIDPALKQSYLGQIPVRGILTGRAVQVEKCKPKPAVFGGKAMIGAGHCDKLVRGVLRIRGHGICNGLI